MQILDGKNHCHGAYEKFVLDWIVELLNTGRHWGFLDVSPMAQNYSSAVLQRADAEFLKTLRALVDQWIASGINEDDTETPSHRYVRGLPKGYSESLFDILHRWLLRNMPQPALMNEGRIAILDQRPKLSHGADAETFAREMAIYYLKELLESPAPDRLGRCQNHKCRTYFGRKRENKGDIKRGAYCGNCKLIGAAERTRLSRQRRGNERMDAAAKIWPLWTKSHRRSNRAEWVAMQVNRQFPHWPEIRGKWVTQNMEQITKRVDEGESSQH